MTRFILIAAALLASFGPALALAGSTLPEQFRGDWCLADTSYHQMKGVAVYLRGACSEPGVDWLEVRHDRFLGHETECKLTSVRNTKRYKYRFKCEQMEGPDLPTIFDIAISSKGHLVLLSHGEIK
jgi:hypothetical protein